MNLAEQQQLISSTVAGLLLDSDCALPPNLEAIVGGATDHLVITAAKHLNASDSLIDSLYRQQCLQRIRYINEGGPPKVSPLFSFTEAGQSQVTLSVGYLFKTAPILRMVGFQNSPPRALIIPTTHTLCAWELSNIISDVYVPDWRRGLITARTSIPFVRLFAETSDGEIVFANGEEPTLARGCYCLGSSVNLDKLSEALPFLNLTSYAHQLFLEFFQSRFLGGRSPNTIHWHLLSEVYSRPDLSQEQRDRIHDAIIYLAVARTRRLRKTCMEVLREFAGPAAQPIP